MPEKFMLLCTCGWKRVSALDSLEDVVELHNDTLGARKFRCPSCGFAVTPRKSKDPQSEVDKLRLEQEMERENRRWLEDSAEKQVKFIKEMESAEKDNDQ